MFDPAIDDMRRLHASADGLDRTANLWQHTAIDRTILDQGIDIPRLQAGNDLFVFIEHTRRIRQQDQFFGRHDLGHLARDQIGIDIQRGAVITDTDRSDHRNKVAANQHIDDIGIDRLDLTDMTDIDDLRRLRLGGTGRNLEFSGPDQVPVLAGQTNGRATIAVDQADDLLVDLATANHLDDIHRLAIGDPHTGHETALLADP